MNGFARFRRRFLRHRAAVAGLAVLVVMALAALAAPLVEAALGLDATQVDLFGRYTPPGGGHLLGTDEAGRDVLLRLLYGGQVSLAVGLAAALGAATIGTLVGLVAGTRGGRTDAFLMRLTDAVIALPVLPLLIVLAAVDLTRLGVPAGAAQSEEAALLRIVAVIALVGWTTVARLVRAGALSVRTRDYVRSAEALGASRLRVAVRHVLPNVVAPVVVATTLAAGNLILLESVLSFLGLGIQPPVPSWGNMLSNAQETIAQAPALALWPGACIFVTVIALNVLGDGLQDALDPRAAAD